MQQKCCTMQVLQRKTRKRMVCTKANKIIDTAMKNGKVTQKALAEAVGLKSAQAIGNILYRENSVRVSSFVKMLDIMGYEVIVRKKIGETEEWRVEE